MLTRAFFDAGIVQCAMLGLSGAILAVRTIRAPFEFIGDRSREPMVLGGMILICAGLTWLVTGQTGGTAAFAGANTMLTGLLWWRLPRLTLAGAIEIAVVPLTIAAGMPWGLLLLAELGFPKWAIVIAAAGGVLASPLAGFGIAARLARHAAFTHRVTNRPLHAPPAATMASPLPRVSIHLPCYAEPADVVIATLDRLAALDYPNFELIVCDNNTEDERLWRPVAEHVARLDRRSGGPDRHFHFFHVASLAGAKAGALNFCLERTAPDATLIAVIDADYLAEPDFLRRLVGFFADPAIGYVQTPHDYRAFGAGAYQRACYWEYMPTNRLVMPGLNEYAAAFTIGTMCLIRSSALREAGGWAEWCLTEDSELSVRLRAHGYHGIYLGETFGRGLIPETFGDYRKQRFRWTTGPVQQLRHHWRLFLPQRFAPESRLNGWSKLLEVQRSAAPIAAVAGLVAGLAGGGLLMVLTIADRLPAILLPPAAWIAVGIASAGAMLRQWHLYRLSGCERLADMIGAKVARASLRYVEMTAGLAGLSARPRAWHRTPKFGARRARAQALRATLPETVLGIAHLALLAPLAVFANTLGPHFVVLAGIGVVVSASRFLAAPLMALWSEREISARIAAPRRDEVPDAVPAMASIKNGG